MCVYNNVTCHHHHHYISQNKIKYENNLSIFPFPFSDIFQISQNQEENIDITTREEEWRRH